MALIAQADLEARLGRTLNADEVNAFNTINAALQAYIERMIGSSIESVSESTRYYDGGVQHLAIDPATDVTAVKWVDEYENTNYTYPTNEYTLEPRNKTLKQQIRYRYKAFPGQFNNIAVTAKFSINGDADALALVKDAMIESLVAEVDNSSNVKRESIEGYSIEFATDVTKDALAKLKTLFVPSL